MIRNFLAMTAAFAVSVPQSASADTVCEWMEFAGRIIEKDVTPPSALRTPEHAQAKTR